MGSGMGLETLREVQDGSLDRRGGPGRVGGASGRSGTGRGTLGVVRNSSLDSGVPGTGRRTLGEVRDGLEDLRGGPERFVGPSMRSRTGRGTLVEVRDGSKNPWRHPVVVKGSLERS